LGKPLKRIGFVRVFRARPRPAQGLYGRELRKR
jgi:hypothetical protein